MTARALPFLGRRTGVAVPRRTAWIVLAVAAVGLYLLFRGQWTLPHERDTEVFQALNGFRDWVEELKRTVPAVGFVLGAVRGGTEWLFEAILGGFTWLGWPGVIAVWTLVAYAAGGWRTGLLTLVGLFALGMLRLWEPSMLTLSLTLAAVLLSLAIGVPLGIVMAKSDAFRAVISPILDFMQIMPQFAYLLPFVLLLGIGAPAAAIITVIYAIPAAIRITALGIRGVPMPSLEAARSLGSTAAQVLTKVELPLARRTIGLAVNQTIMLALSMVVITALIDAPGLGVNILRAVQILNVGQLFNVSLAIVILAVVLDRLTEQASRRMDAREQALAAEATGRRRIDRRVALLGLGAVAVAAIALRLVNPQATESFPDEWAVLSFRDPVNNAVKWINTNLFFVTVGLKEAFTAVVIGPIETVLRTSPVWLVIGAAGAMAWLVSGARAAIIASVALLAVAGLRLWDHSMMTLTQVLVATAITLALGGFLGILAASNNAFSRAIRPFLDAAQTMPAFVYLLPALALFQHGRFTAIVAAVIFAIPPVVRLVEAGIRLVPAVVIEAGTAAGATRFQLLRKIQLPVARPALLLALNQGIIMVLGMVVLGGLVGGQALGFDVVSGFAQRRDFGLGLTAGLCIVLLGVALDRISAGAGRRRVIESPREVGARTVAATEPTAA